MSKHVWPRLLALSACVAVIGDGHAAAYDGPPYSTAGAHGPQGQNWHEVAQLPDWSGAWGLDEPSFREVVSTSDGPREIPPFTPAYVKKHRDNVADRHRGDTQGNNSAACVPDGMPNIMSAPFAFEFLFTPGRVTIIPENNEVRRISTNRTSHPADLSPSFEGDSIGHWENGVLVVDTVGLNPRAELFVGVHVTSRIRIVERMFRKSLQVFEIDTTVYDSAMFVRPYRYTRTFQLSPAGMLQAFCTENNRDSNNRVDLTPPPAEQ